MVRYATKTAVKQRVRGMTDADTALQALKNASLLKKLVKSPPVKFVDVAVSAGTFAQAGLTASLMPIAQGDDYDNRSGLRVLPRSVEIRLEMTSNGTTSNAALQRVIVFRDKQQVGDTIPGVLNVLETATNESPINEIDNAGRFQILYDRVHTLQPPGSSLIGATNITDKSLIVIKKKLSGYVQYNGAASTDIQKNGIYLLLMTDVGSGFPVYSYWSRLSYTD